MGIRKPSLSVKEARTLASVRSTASEKAGVLNTPDQASAPRNFSSMSQTRKSEKTSLRDLDKKGENETRSKTSEPIVVAQPKSSAGPSDKAHPSAPASPQATGMIADSLFLRPEARRDKVQVFLSAPFPAAGVSPTFELLCRQYSPQKALQMILRKALLSYERLLANGTFQRVDHSYDVDSVTIPEAIQTSRMMPDHIVTIARAHFDPLGLESTRAFGRKLGTAALAAFFVNERAR